MSFVYIRAVCTNPVIGRADRLQNDLLCVERDAKCYYTILYQAVLLIAVFSSYFSAVFDICTPDLHQSVLFSGIR